MKIMLIIMALTMMGPSWGNTCSSKGPNVVFFTWDGIRSKEFFKGEIFSNLWNKHAKEGMVLGGGDHYRIGSDVGVSLPSYQAMMVGKSTGCTKNDKCSALKQESMLETIRTGLDLPKKDVAVFASWNMIIKAVAQDPSNITHGIFPEIMNSDSSDEEMKHIQEKAMLDLPKWGGSRKDEYTFALSMHYLKKNCPRVLWISLVDSDEFAHQGNYLAYVESMKKYDGYLDTLLGQLKQMDNYGSQTTVIVTTDHSRGPGPFWRTHGHINYSDKKVFLFATGRGVVDRGHTNGKGNHLMLRATIEGLMGLTPHGSILPGIQLNHPADGSARPAGKDQIATFDQGLQRKIVAKKIRHTLSKPIGTHLPKLQPVTGF